MISKTARDSCKPSCKLVKITRDILKVELNYVNFKPQKFSLKYLLNLTHVTEPLKERTVKHTAEINACKRPCRYRHIGFY